MNDRHRDYLIKAVSPTLFSAALHPDLLIALILANLLSPRLWELAARIQGDGVREPAVLLPRLHQYVNRHFYHPDSLRFARVWGLHEREVIPGQAERAASDRAMAIIEGALKIHETGVNERLFSFIEHGAFPRYVYPTVDLILAYGPLLKKDVKSRPLGMTSCLDECVLIASLALALGACTLDEIVLVGSPAHYTLFVFTEDDGYLFNAKREFFTSRDWRALSGGDEQRSIQWFADKLFVCDRIISPFGYCVFPDGPATIGSDRMESIAQRIARFLAAWPLELTQAQATAARSTAQPLANETIGDAATPLTRESVTAAILGSREGAVAPLIEAARYAFRSPLVKEPGLYREAARRGFRSYILSGAVLSPADAWEIADGIQGTESIHGPTARLAMPDEVLAFDTASDEERELLVDTLLHHAQLTG